jgi:hypothetical protein
MKGTISIRTRRTPSNVPPTRYMQLTCARAHAHTQTRTHTHSLTHNPQGALEGISYLVVVGFVLTSLRQKIKTGAGLPAGPSGLLGAAEGLSFASVLGGLVILWLLVLDRGCVPNAQPLLDYSAYVTVCD